MLHTCGNSVIIDLSKHIMIAGTIDIKNKESLVVTELFLQNRETAIEELYIWCQVCKERVDMDSLSMYCSFCSKVIPIKELQLYQSNTGVYCPKCIKENDMKPSRLSPVTDSFSSISLR